MRRADRGSGAARARGRLKISDGWNAITITALSQSNPMKAVAELIANSVDAKARSLNRAERLGKNGQHIGRPVLHEWTETHSGPCAFAPGSRSEHADEAEAGDFPGEAVAQYTGR